MPVTTILAFRDPDDIRLRTEYASEFDQEISKTSALDMTGLGTPQVARTETLEEVLDLLGKASGGVALIYAHANANGLIMRIADRAKSAQSNPVRGISRAWKAIDEIIRLRSGKWPPKGQPGKPEFLVDVSGAVTLFKGLVNDLRQVEGSHADRLPDPAGVTNRDQADAWFDTWMELMGKACLGDGFGESDLRRICRAMQKVRDARFDRIEFRSCNIGKDKDNLNVFKEFFGAKMVIAPKTTMFCGRAAVNLNAGGNLGQLARQLGGFRGTHFTAPGAPGSALDRMPHTEPELATGHRNRIFPEQGPPDAIMQLSAVLPFHFHFSGRIFSTTPAAMTRFVQTNFKAGATFAANRRALPVAGMWAPSDPNAHVPFILPLETAYRDFLETSS